MKLFYHIDKEGNFGDDFNAWLWQQFFPKDFFDEDESITFIGMGTIFGKGTLDATPNAQKRIVFGSGTGYSSLVELDESWDVRFVRGEGTATRYGLPREKAITDPAIIVAKVVEPVAKQYKVSFIPHHTSVRYGNWKEICELAGIHYISPCNDCKFVTDEINKTELLLTEAMHGAITADALRVPWVPIKTNDYILDFKWNDWSKTHNIEFEFQNVEAVYRSSLEYSIADQIKNAVKIVLHKVMGKKFSIIRPLRGTPMGSKKHVAEQLKVAINSHRYLSEQAIFEQRLEQVLSEIDSLAKEFKK